MFKKYLLDNEAREFINAVNLYHEIDVYHKTESKPKTKKDLQVALSRNEDSEIVLEEPSCSPSRGADTDFNLRN